MNHKNCAGKLARALLLHYGHPSKPPDINELDDVTLPKLQLECSSTPLMGNASILLMDYSASMQVGPKGAPNSVTLRNPCAREARRGTLRRERGAGHLKAIVWTLVLGCAVYVGFKVIPLLVNEYQFQDGLQTIARFASVNRDPSEKVKQAILKEAQKDDVPVQAEDIKIEGSGGNIRINADYSQTVDLKVYEWTLNFHPKVSNDALF